MKKQNHHNKFKSQRSNTDSSLVAERDRTTSEIMRAQSSAEAKTNRVVRLERETADIATSFSSNGATVGAAVERERGAIDAAITTERSTTSKLITKTLETERGRTDSSLKVERDDIDTELTRTSTLLSDEVAHHQQTRVSLTSRDEFLAITSHDLRSPIGAVASCAQMLLEDESYASMDKDTREWIGFIRRNAETALRLISDLLDMERLAEGKLQLNQGNHEINLILRESVESYVYLAAAKNILLRTNGPKNETLVWCDRDRVQQVLSNLIGNALKFSPDQGTVSVAADVIDGKVRVSVQDTGQGIPMEKQTSIFERFAQIKTADRRGLGLGLYISKMLVEAHGSNLHVKSTVGKGSTFYFDLAVGKNV